MRSAFAAGLTGLVLVSLVACNRSGQAGASSSATAGEAPAAAGSLTTGQMPRRAPGLWTQTISMDGETATAGSTQLCVDAASEARVSLAAQNMPGAHCGAPLLTTGPDGSIAFTSHCDMGANGRTQSTGVIKGDFNSGYTVTLATTTSGGPVAAMNGAHTMVISATRTGPCAPGQRGGDMILPNGMKVNALDAAGAASPGRGN